MVLSPCPLILEQDHLGAVAAAIQHIDPHPVLRLRFLVRFIQYLDMGFIAMGVVALQEHFLYPVIQRFQKTLGTQYDPVRHGLCAQIQVIPSEFALLAGQRHPIDIFCIHNSCHKGRGRNAPLKERERFLRPLHGRKHFGQEYTWTASSRTSK